MRVSRRNPIHARGEGERVLALESREGTRASRRVEEGLSRSFSGGGGKPSFPLTSAGDLRELPRVPLRGEGSCGGGGAPRDSAGSGATPLCNPMDCRPPGSSVHGISQARILEWVGISFSRPVLCCRTQVFSSCSASRGYSLAAVCRFLNAAASPVAERGL